MDMALGQPGRLRRPVEPGREAAHRPGIVADETVAGGQLAFGRDCEIAGPGAAGIGPVRALVQLLQGV